MKPISVCILTVSDRSFHGLREDLSGPRLKEAVEKIGWQVLDSKIVPDDSQKIQKVLIEWSESSTSPQVIMTTGGTGFAPRDVTPEATFKVIEKEAPGLAEMMRYRGLDSSPYSMLSRGVVGIRKKSIIINLPGSPKAAVESISSILELLPHAVAVLIEDPTAESQHS